MMTIYNLARDIGRIPPGECLTVSHCVLEKLAVQMPLTGLPGPFWSPPERVMENITGSAYEFQFRQDPETGYVIFTRLLSPLKDGSKTYVSPDRKHLYDLGADGFYRVTQDP